jgi:hypothetical protein
MKRHLHPTAALSAVFLLVLVGCEASKSSNPLSPAVAGPIAGVNITEPKLLEPTQGFKFKESQQPIKLVVENAATNGVRTLSYAFEVSSDADFTNKVYARSGVPPGEGGRTSVVIERLELGRAYYWRARAEDGANSGQFASASFNVLPRALLNPPPQVTPVNGITTATRRPEMIVGYSVRNETIGWVRYEFQIASDPAFGSIVASALVDEGGGNTGFTPGGDLAASTQYFWRARATDGETTSSWTAAQGFRTPAAAPAPGPSPGPGPTNPSGPCNFSSGEAIVQCERAKYGFMNSGQVVAFLKSVADSLNRNGISGGRFGLLIKESGNQCGGYSCDIICSGNGGAQRQWDVLSDVEGSQGAMWGELDRSHIQVRTCEIR